jgi:hypothetical protein
MERDKHGDYIFEGIGEEIVSPFSVGKSSKSRVQLPTESQGFRSAWSSKIDIFELISVLDVSDRSTWQAA